MMKTIYYSIIIIMINSSCLENNKQDLPKYYRTYIDTLNDSTITVKNWNDSISGNYYKIIKGDTIEHALLKIDKNYLQETFVNKKAKIYKLRLNVEQQVDYKLNEIVFFDNTGKIKENESTFIQCEVLQDSVKLILPACFFNRTKILIGDINSFEESKWINPDTLESNKNYITISKKYLLKKCLLTGIKDTLTKQGNEYLKTEAAVNIYFDLNNLIKRDVTKSLLWCCAAAQR